MIEAFKIQSNADLKAAFAIREAVFMVEQGVDREEEFDEFEGVSIHYLAKEGDVPCGTCRWRSTDKGIKLERIAVAQSHRRKGVASLLIQAMLDDINADPAIDTSYIYLNAQVDAMPLYAKFGFLAEGSTFMECDILHQKMVLDQPV